MKALENMTDAELTALTDEEIDDIIKLKKAEAGIKILRLPVYPELRPIPTPDVEVYEVAGYAFTDKEIAQKFANDTNDVIPSAVRVGYDYWHGSSRQEYVTGKEASLVQIEVKHVHSSLQYASIKDAVTSNKRVEEAYEKVKKEYDEEEERAKDIASGVFDRVQGARDRINEVAGHVEHIVEYLKLSNGDVEVAWNFLKKAYVIDPEVENQVRASEEYQVAITP